MPDYWFALGPPDLGNLLGVGCTADFCARVVFDLRDGQVGRLDEAAALESIGDDGAKRTARRRIDQTEDVVRITVAVLPQREPNLA